MLSPARAGSTNSLIAALLHPEPNAVTRPGQESTGNSTIPRISRTSLHAYGLSTASSSRRATCTIRKHGSRTCRFICSRWNSNRQRRSVGCSSKAPCRATSPTSILVWTTRTRSTVSAARSADGSRSLRACGAATSPGRQSPSSKGAARCGTHFPREDGVRVARTSGVGPRACAAKAGRCTTNGTKKVRGYNRAEMQAPAFWKAVTVDRSNLLEQFLSLLQTHQVQFWLIAVRTSPSPPSVDRKAARAPGCR